ncbi:unnamed protein product [Lathyrus oleraceus]
MITVLQDMGFTVRKAMACCRSNASVLDADAGWTVEDVPCGNRVALAGLDQFITRNATLTNEKEVDAHPIRAMKFSVACVCVAVQCTVDLDSKLVEGLKRLPKSDPMVL